MSRFFQTVLPGLMIIFISWFAYTFNNVVSDVSVIKHQLQILEKFEKRISHHEKRISDNEKDIALLKK